MRQRQVTVLPAGLREWRKAKGLTQETLAIAADCSPTLVAFIETGKRQPSLGTALAIAKALGVPLDAFAVVHVDMSSFEPEAVA